MDKTIAENNKVEFKFAPAWLKQCAKANHFSPTFYAMRGTPGQPGFECKAWNSKREENYGSEDWDYAHQYFA